MSTERCFETSLTFILDSAGVLEPLRELGWWRWMNRVSPATYFIEGFLGQGWSYTICVLWANLTEG